MPDDDQLQLRAMTASGELEGDLGPDIGEAGQQSIGEPDSNSPEKESAAYEAQLQVMEERSIEFRHQTSELTKNTAGELTDKVDLSLLPYGEFFCALDATDSCDQTTISSTVKRTARLERLNEVLNEPNSTVIKGDILKEKHALLIAQATEDAFVMKKRVFSALTAHLRDINAAMDAPDQDAAELLEELNPYIKLSQTAVIYFDTAVANAAQKFEEKYQSQASNFLKKAAEQLDRELGDSTVVALESADGSQHKSLLRALNTSELNALPTKLNDLKALLEKELTESSNTPLVDANRPSKNETAPNPGSQTSEDPGV